LGNGGFRGGWLGYHIFVVYDLLAIALKVADHMW